MEAYTHNMDETVVRMNNRWEKNIRGQRTNPFFRMRLVYTEVCVSFEESLPYSQSLW